MQLFLIGHNRAGIRWFFLPSMYFLQLWFIRWHKTDISSVVGTTITTTWFVYINTITCPADHGGDYYYYRTGSVNVIHTHTHTTIVRKSYNEMRRKTLYYDIIGYIPSFPRFDWLLVCFRKVSNHGAWRNLGIVIDKYTK